MPTAFENVFGDTAADWAATNPIMGPNDLLLETDSAKIKVGDGVHPYLSLAYSVGNPEAARLGNLPNNVVTPANMCRSNLFVPFLGNMVTGANLATGVATLVAIPVNTGDTISNVTVLSVGAESGGSHAWAAIYSGVLTTALLLGAQSVDATGAAVIGANAAYTFALATPAVVTAANAPYGYIYVAISVTGTPPTLVSASCAVAVQYAWYPGTPKLAAQNGSALVGVAPASFTLASGTAQATVPIVILT